MRCSTSNRGGNQGWLALALIATMIGGVWGVALPRLAETQTVRERNAFLEEHRIDPAAMFYTELECLEP